MNREELKAAVKDVYEQGYHDGFVGACDVLAPALTDTITSIVTKLRERAQEVEAEIIDDLEEKE